MNPELLKASDGTGNAVLAHVTIQRLVGATVLKVDSVSKWNAAGFVATTGTLGSDGFLTPGTVTEFVGHILAGDIIIDSYEPGFTDIGNAVNQVVIIKQTTGWANRMQQAAVLMNTFVTTNGDWRSPASLPVASMAYNGNRNYLCTITGDATSYLSAGMKFRGTRTVAAPTKVALFNGTTQYLNKATPNKLTFTDNFTLLATGKISAYPAGNSYLGGRSDAASNNGYGLFVNSNGQVGMIGFNGGVGNWRQVVSYQRVPLNREFKLRATWASGTLLLYLDGQLMAAATTTLGTAPTTIAQGTGDLAIGRLGSNGTGTWFAGEVSQFAIFGAVLTAAQIKAIDSQGLLGTETNFLTGFSLNNVITDLNTTTPNDLTNNNAVTFPTSGGFGNYGASASFDYGLIVTTPVFAAGNTTFQIQCPVGCTMPTTTTPLSAWAYSTMEAPLGYPVRNIMLKSFDISTFNFNTLNPGNGDFNLDSSGLSYGVFVPIDCYVKVRVDLGVGASSDFEFRPEVRVDGVVAAKLTPAAALGSAGTRGMDRGLTSDVWLTAGYHVIAAGLELIAGGGYVLAGGGGALDISVPLSIMA